MGKKWEGKHCTIDGTGKTAIIGFGGFGREVRAAYGKKDKENITFLVTPGHEHLFVDTLDKETLSSEFTTVILAIGDSKARRRIAEDLGPVVTRSLFPNIVQDSRKFCKKLDRNHITFDLGSIICKGSILTCDISIGKFSIINIGCMVGHDVKIGDFVTMSPSCNIMGGAIIEDDVELGTNVTVLPGVTVGKGSVIGAGAVVTKDIPPNSVAVGVPAKVIKSL